MDFNVNVNVRTTGAEKIDALEKQIQSLKTNSVKIKVELDQSALSKLKVGDTGITIRPKVDTSGIKQATKDFQMVKNLANQISQTKIKIAGLDPSKNANEISVLQTQLKHMESDYKSLMKNLGSGFDKSQLGNLENIFGKADDKIAQINAKAKDLNNTLKASAKEFNQLDATTASNKTLAWLKNNSAAAKNYGDVLKDLANKQKNATNAEELKNYTKQVNEIKSIAAAAGKTGKSYLEELGQGFKYIGTFASTYGLVQRIPQTIRKMVNAVVEVDTAMTNLYKVTDETDAKYTEFLNNAGNTAKNLGRDMSSYIEQTANWSKLGYTIDQSTNLAKVSSMYANVGEVDDDTAVSDLVTVMKAYNITADDALTIVDKYNKLGNEFATSAKDLGEGMSNAASMLALGGTDLNKALALLTGGSEITQSADELGNALKIGQMRIQGMKGDLEALGEESEGLESVSKIQTHILNLTKGQVNIMNSADPTKFRDYYDILEDVSKVWNDLEQTEQADLLETMFGKNRGNQGAAVIQAFQSGQVQKAYEATLNAKGSAQAEQDRWMQSAEAKLQQFQAQFQELSTTTIDSDIFKGLVDSGTELLNILTQIIDVGGGIPVVLGAIGAVNLFKNLDHQKVFKNLPIFLNWSNIDKEMIKWFIVQVYVFGSFKINQRGVNAGTDTHEYSTKAELATINVNVRKAEKQNIRHMVNYVQT